MREYPAHDDGGVTGRLRGRRFNASQQIMFILLPTFDPSARIAEITLELLRRNWPGHPPVHVLHHSRAPRHTAENVRLQDRGPDGSRWLGNVTDFLAGRTEDLFLLLLDDYAVCGPVRVNAVARAAELMRRDPLVGLFPLCWYPAAGRVARAGWEGIETLAGTPILLQAAMWRRSWFLELAQTMDGRASPWSFEAMATRAARSRRLDICAAKMPEPRYVGGHLVDGFDKTDWPIPYHNLMHRGEPNGDHAGFLRREGFAFPSRGLGDTVSKLAEASGLTKIATAIESATGRPCGCAGRQAALNRLVPYARDR